MQKNPATSIRQQLIDRPWAFDFFQAVRLLNFETTFRDAQTNRKVGYTVRPREEILRFRTSPTLRFSPADISAFTPPSPMAKPASLERPAELTVLFMGLTGPQGVLPQHYSQAVIDQDRENQHALHDFFDLFNHRMISLFYRAWEKYRFEIRYEQMCLTEHGTDDFTQSIFSFVGMGTPGLRQRLDVDDRLLAYFGGQMSRMQPNVISLERMLSEHFQLSVNVQQFVGEWLHLSTEDQTTLGQGNCDLGHSTIVGDKVWGIENRFRIQLGPLGYDEYARYMPGGVLHDHMAQFVRMYVGPEFDFDLQPILHAESVPPLTFAECPEARLGWNTWLHSGPIKDDKYDATFDCCGRPNK